MATHGVLRDATLEPDLVDLVTSSVDAYTSSVVIDTGEDKVDTLTVKTTSRNVFLEAIEVLDGTNVFIVSFHFTSILSQILIITYSQRQF